MSPGDPHKPDAERLITAREILPYLMIVFGSAVLLAILA